MTDTLAMQLPPEGRPTVPKGPRTPWELFLSEMIGTGMPRQWDSVRSAALFVAIGGTEERDRHVAGESERTISADRLRPEVLNEEKEQIDYGTHRS